MRPRLPPLNALKAFEAAARHESFTRAAEELCVTQGAVSHQVKALEGELAVKLFNRERQRLIITRRFGLDGRDPATLGRDDETVRRIGTFVELHVEQGKALALTPDGGEDLTDPTRAVAIGTDIWPHGRWRVDIPGEANHAGTTRIADRQDAMIGLATVIQAARSYAVGLGCVATVGKVHVVPGGVNAIPSHVTAWLDVRGRSEHVVHAAVDAVSSEAGRLGATTTPESWTPTTTFDTGLVGRLRGILPDAPLLGTGAGHDAGILATHGVPSAMLFVRNPTGVSHSPAELASTDDCHHGVTALTAVVTELCTGKDPESMSDAR